MELRCSVVITSGRGAGSTLLYNESHIGIVHGAKATLVQRWIATVVSNVKRSWVACRVFQNQSRDFHGSVFLVIVRGENVGTVRKNVPR